MKQEVMMRTEQEMMELIVETAREDERILAVYMNGSRTNQNAPKDIFQDYDIVYVVQETESFIRDREWIDRFGQRLFMQYPEENDFFPNETDKNYGWLIQFSDGSRLDLHVQKKDYALQEIKKDSLCIILLDKNGILPELPRSSDKSHWVKKPDEASFLFASNEFWWCLDNVAKGLWREELTYVQDMLNLNIRPMLLQMLSWKIGTDTDFSVSVGKSGKYMHRYLTKEEWNRYLLTFAPCDLQKLWEAVMIMCAQFDFISQEVAQKLHFKYNEEEAHSCLAYLNHVKDKGHSDELFKDLL